MQLTHLADLWPQGHMGHPMGLLLPCVLCGHLHVLGVCRVCISGEGTTFSCTSYLTIHRGDGERVLFGLTSSLVPFLTCLPSWTTAILDHTYRHSSYYVLEVVPLINPLFYRTIVSQFLPNAWLNCSISSLSWHSHIYLKAAIDLYCSYPELPFL